MYEEPCTQWAEKLALHVGAHTPEQRGNDAGASSFAQPRRKEVLIAPAEREALQRHLQACPACAAAAADYALLAANLRSLPPPTLKPLPRLSRATERWHDERPFVAAQPGRTPPAPIPLPVEPVPAMAASRAMPERFIRGTRVGGVVALAVFAILLLVHAIQLAPGPASWNHPHALAALTATSWSPNELQIVSPSVDETIAVWSTVTGRRVFTFHGQTGAISAAAWSPDGTRIALAGTTEQTVQVWNVLTGKLLLTYYGHSGPVFALAWSPDGKYIASAGGDQTVQVWNAANGIQRTIYSGHLGPIYTVAWSPDGKEIASAGSDQTVQVWRAFTGLRLLTYYGHSGPVSAVAWSPDGKHIASASIDQTVQVWNASTGVALSIYTGHHGPVSAVAWSPDGKEIASAGADRTVQIWNAFSGQHLLTYSGHTAPVFTVAWSPDGKQIASEGTDQTIQVWNVQNGRLTELFMLSRS